MNKGYKLMRRVEREYWFDLAIEETLFGRHNAMTKRKLWAKVMRKYKENEPPSWKWFNNKRTLLNEYARRKMIPLIWCAGHGVYKAESAEELELHRVQYGKPLTDGHEQVYNDRNVAFFPVFSDDMPSLKKAHEKNGGLFRKFLSATGITR